MPDPYATRAPDLSGRPSGPAPWLERIQARGGATIGTDGGFPAEAGFLTVDCRGIGTLAPFTRVDPALATLLWLEHDAAPPSAATANDLLGRLREFGGPVFALKQGSVAGPPERPGCFAIGEELIGTVLAAALDGEVGWEVDPDFGYEVPAVVPALGEPDARALLPRLLYADHDRVYEHASLVAAKKRERAAAAGRLEGLDPAVAGASGWPPTPSPSDWRE